MSALLGSRRSLRRCWPTTNEEGESSHEYSGILNCLQDTNQISIYKIDRLNYIMFYPGWNTILDVEWHETVLSEKTVGFLYTTKYYVLNLYFICIYKVFFFHCYNQIMRFTCIPVVLE